jgi:Kef-type K+ transport system membrane component KefB
MLKLKVVVTYICLVGIPLLALSGIMRLGQSLTAPPAAGGALSPAAEQPLMPNLLTLVLQIAVIIAVSTAIAVVFQKMRQPKVIGEMFAGIMLGPSLLGWVAPNMSAALFPPSSLGFLSALSQVGAVIYMFLVGLAINPRALRDHGHTAVLASHMSIIAPFVMGAGLAVFLYPRFSDSSVSFPGFGLFMGSAMSITAFPVLARILNTRGMLGTKLGSLAIACAAVDDVTGWCILAYIVLSVRTHQEAALSLWFTIGGLIVFVGLMLSVVRRFLTHFEARFKKDGQLSENMLALLMLIVLLSAVTTERLGLHLLFGSFLAGAIMPKDKKFVSSILEKFETTTIVLLLPLYFAFTGLRTSIQLIDGFAMWTVCIAIIVVAILGKVGGSMLAARVSGNDWRESAALGILMNTRGLMGLVILNIGLDIGIISPVLFSMMVVMALATTFMTAPLFQWVYPSRLLAQETTDSSKKDPVLYEPA